MKNKNLILALAVITTGLSAGLFYAYSVSVNPAFTRLSDASYIAAMQAIDDVIQNPVFFASFMGAAVLLPLAAYLHRSKPASLKFKLLIAASALYIVGTFGVTASANVPLNDTLGKVSLTASAQELAKARADYAEPWNNWHTVRTVAAVAAFVAATAACLMPETTRSGAASSKQQR